MAIDQLYMTTKLNEISSSRLLPSHCPTMPKSSVTSWCAPNLWEACSRETCNITCIRNKQCKFTTCALQWLCIEMVPGFATMWPRRMSSRFMPRIRSPTWSPASARSSVWWNISTPTTSIKHLPSTRRLSHHTAPVQPIVVISSLRRKLSPPRWRKTKDFL